MTSPSPLPELDYRRLLDESIFLGKGIKKTVTLESVKQRELAIVERLKDIEEKLGHDAISEISELIAELERKE
jgi:hypothetical protein